MSIKTLSTDRTVRSTERQVAALASLAVAIAILAAPVLAALVTEGTIEVEKVEKPEEKSNR